MAGRHRFTGGLPHGPDPSPEGDSPATEPRRAGNAGRTTGAGWTGNAGRATGAGRYGDPGRTTGAGHDTGARRASASAYRCGAAR